MNDDAPPGWLTISDLAREKGVDKSAISRRVARLEAAGLVSPRRHGQSKIVNVAEYDRATAATVDAVREANGRGPTGPPDEGGAGDPVLARAQAWRAAYDAEWKRLDLDERMKRLLKVDDVRPALEAIAVELARGLDALPARAEALAAVVAEGGAMGLRVALKAAARELRDSLSSAAKRFGEAEPDASDPVDAEGAA